MKEPMLLRPVGKDYLWGGDRLKTEYYKNLKETPLAETWECSVHPNGPSIVAGGAFKGQTLASVLEKHPEYLGDRSDGKLSILVKLIDANAALSVQVHPDDEYALINEGQNGKFEMWYVLDALPGAKLIHGFAHDVTPEQLEKSMRDGDIAKHLKSVEIHKGDVFFIPPGKVHAIGAGALIVEIQQSSDVTYRVYDYDRVDKNGKKRELHFAKAMDVLDMKAENAVRQMPRLVQYRPGCARQILGRCKYFETERIQISMGYSFIVNESSFQVLLCIEGRGGLETKGDYRPLRFAKGDCIFIPAGMGKCLILGHATLLKIRT